MKKNYIITLLFLLVYQLFSAQTTETFEDETAASTSFTDNGQVFNITSQAQGPFDIQAAYPGSGWNGISADNKYIDNDGHASPNVGVQFTISSAGATVFQLKSLYLYIANSNGTFPTTGTCTITGKLAGTTVFTASASTGFNISPIVNNGFTLIDMLNYGGADNSSTSIDQYIITTTGSIAYIALDAMKWQKFCTPVTVAPLAQTNVSCNGGNNGSASVMASGGTGFTYNWTPGNPTGDATPTVTGLTPGLWTCTVTNSCGNSNSTTFTITQPSLITATTSQTNVSCNGTNNGVASVTTSGGTGTYTYSWAPSGGTAATASGLTAGAYTVTIKDANLCTITKNFTITQPPAITATMIQTDVSCNGANNGSASVIVSGGTPFYTYSWAPTGGTAATASGLTAGNYTVTITDLNLCTLTKTFTITQPSLITATTGQTNVSCNGGTDGSATVTVSGGTPNYTYSWAPTGGAAPTASGLTPGVYTVTITDLNSCTLTKSFTITQPSLITATTTQNNVSCNGSNNGSATVTVSGGTPNYTYSWAPSGGTAATASGLTAGAYTVTIKDANLCSITKNFIISQPAPIAATTTQNNVSCNGGNNGSATVTVSGGTPNYTYSWAPSGGTAATASGLVPGIYTVTITDANLCSITKTFTITQPAPIVATITQNNVSCNGNNNGSATVTVSGGTPTYTYSWAPSGGTAATASGLVPGIYTVTITDANLCSITKTFTITQPAPMAVTPSQNNVSCNGDSNGSATVTVSGGTPNYTYSWAPTGGTAATASGLTAGNYTVTITDANNCTTTQNFTINEPTPMAVTAIQTDVPCNGGSNGSATVTVSGGTPTYTYSWSPSGGTAATASGLTAGNYTVTITDASNCTTTQSFTINEPTLMAVTAVQTDVPCNGGSNGSATVTVSGGTGAYTYSWSPSGGTAATASGLTAGNYTVTITDANNCTTTQNFTINEPAPMAVTAAQTDVPCNGGSNGSATVTVSGGTGAYTYSWAPTGGTAATASGLTAGNYTVTITDANNCTTTQSFTINEPTPITVTAVQTDVPCNGTSNGSATVTVSGGTGAYTYSWSPSGGTAATASGLTAGNYTVTITDANSCTTTQSFVINEPTPMVVVTSQNNVPCNGASNGSATVTVSGGTGAYTYSWSPSGGTAATASGLTAGNYTVTITDANNCTTTQSFVINEPAPIAVTATQTNVSCNGASNGSATVTVSGGTGTYTYSWSPSGGTAATASGLTAGNYTVTITDANNCTTTQSFVITEPIAVFINTQPLSNTITAGQNTTFTIGSTNATGYQWQMSTNNGGNWNNVSNGGTNPLFAGATTATLTLTNIPKIYDGYLFRVLVNSGTCAPSTSSSATLTVNNILIQAVDDNFTATPVNNASGGIAGNVITNDLFNSLPVVSTDVTITLVNNGGLTGVTIGNDGSVNVLPSSTQGTYTLTYSICEIANPGNCDSATAIVVVSPPLSVGTFETFTVSLYPNPTISEVFIKFNEIHQDAKVHVYDMNGRKIMERPLRSTINSIDLSGFEDGVYLFEINSVNGKTIKRVIKKP